MTETSSRSIWAGDGSAEPGPSTAVSGWSKAKVLYTYDPSRYEEIVVNKVVYLCALSNPGHRRRPCQKGNHLQSVARADLWTDGTYVYAGP